jgi:hypothetical protein
MPEYGQSKRNYLLVDGIPRLVLAQSDAAKRNEAKASMQEGSSSFLKKRTKKLLLSSVRCGRAHRVTNIVKVFWFFFSKKNCFLCGLYPVSPDSFV